MKKVIALILILIMSVCAAEPMDFSNVSNEELLSVYHQILKEITDRNITAPFLLPRGIYTIGEDIKAGKYIISGNDAGVAVYENYDGYKIKKNIKFVVQCTEDNEAFVDLKDGNVFVINYGNVGIRKFEPIM